MLILQIAAGILLAALVWRFWKQALRLAGVLAVVGTCLFVVLILVEAKLYGLVGVMAGAFVVPLAGKKWQQRRKADEIPEHTIEP